MTIERKYKPLNLPYDRQQPISLAKDEQTKRATALYNVIYDCQQQQQQPIYKKSWKNTIV
jgi:hypothetical protein